jgi:hypothetical protein
LEKVESRNGKAEGNIEHPADGRPGGRAEAERLKAEIYFNFRFSFQLFRTAARSAHGAWRTKQDGCHADFWRKTRRRPGAAACLQKNRKLKAESLSWKS